MLQKSTNVNAAKLLFCLCFLTLSSQIFGQQPPTIQICSGNQEVCIDGPTFEICVTIDVNAGFTEPIESFEIDWGDDTNVTIVPGSNNPPDQFHTYDLSDFFGTCQYAYDDIVVRLETILSDGSRLNNAFFPTFKNKPIAVIDIDQNIVCVNEEFCFGDSSCPLENLEVVSWNFGDGSPVSTNGCHTFTTPGTYTVSLTVQNDCGMDTDTETIQVIAPATAVANVLSGVLDLNIDNPYQICLNGDTALVMLEGFMDSENETSYLWTVITGTPFQWLPESLSTPDSSEMSIQFWEEGLYTIVLRTDNPCEQPAFDTLHFEVLGGGFSLNPQPDACVSLDYTPDPLEANVVYTINGDVVTVFPITLFEGDYLVEVTGASTVCQTAALTDNFSVSAEQNAQIQTPDTTICSLDGLFTFEATPAVGGEWRIDGVVFDGTIDPEAYLEGPHTITYGNEPCITSDMIILTIVKADITMPIDKEVCIDDDPVTFVADPPGGTWSGPGIDATGVFDPALTGVGTFTLFYAVMNPTFSSCSNIDSVQVTVSELFVDFEVTSCEGNTLCFALVNSSNFTSIFWDFGAAGTSTQIAPCPTFPGPGSYDVTVTIFNGGCSADTTKTITIEPAPVADFSLIYNSDLCAPLTVEIINNQPNSGWIYEWRLNGVIFSNLASPDPLLLEAFAQDMLFDISLTVRNDCASDSQSESLLVHPLPVANFGTDQNQYCSGDTILMANISVGNPENAAWYLNGDLISMDTTPPIISWMTAVVDTLDICLVIENSCGRDTLCREVVVIPTDVNAFFNTSPTIVCTGDTVWFTNFSTLGVPVFYDFGDGNSTANANPFHVYDQAGTYPVVQQAFGCGFDTFQKTIEVFDGPTATWNNPTFGCPGETLFFENTSLDIMQYEWDFGDGTPNSEEESPDHAFSASGFYEVCLTVYSASVSGCTHTLCQTVEIYAAPTAGFSFTDSLCLGEVVVFNNMASVDVVMCDYSFGDGNSLADCNPTHEYSTPGIFLTTQIVENANFCKDTLSQQVFIRELPTSAFSFALMNGCHPDSVVFTNNSQNADSYLWNFGDNTTSTSTNPTHFYQNPGTYTVTLTAMIDGICSSQLTQVVVIDETPDAIFVPDVMSSCAGLEVTFVNNSTGAITDTIWSFGDGFFSFEASPTHTFQTPGVYTVQLIVSNDGACADTSNYEMTIHEALAAEFSQQNILCNGAQTGSIDLTVTSGTGPFSFDWSNGSESEDIDALPAGSYDLMMRDSNGCVWSATIELTEPEAIAVTADETVVSCFGGSDGSLEVEITGGIGPYELLWETGAIGPMIENLTAGNYDLTITDDNDCVLATTITLSQNQPIEYFDSIQHISCFGANDGVLALDSIFGGFPPFNIQLMSNDFEEGGINVTRFDSLTPNVYSLQIEDANGCQELLELEILEPGPIFINIPEDTIEISLGESRKLLTFFNANNPFFLWSPPNRLDCVDCSAPIAAPFVNESYTVTMTDENGCIAMDTVAILVKVNRNVFIPSAFTPNGDSRNDIFRIRSEFEASIARIRVFRVFDRWGELLFEQKDFPPNDRQYGWDGFFKGERAEPGVYVYYVEVEYVDGEVLLWKGDVFLGR